MKRRSLHSIALLTAVPSMAIALGACPRFGLEGSGGSGASSSTTATTISSTNNTSAFAAAFDPSNNQFIWATPFAAPSDASGGVFTMGVVSRADKNLEVVGSFQGQMSLVGSTTLACSAAVCGFAVELRAADGSAGPNPIALQPNGPPSQIQINAAAAAGSDLVLGGSFTGSATLGGTTYTAASPADTLVLRLSPSSGAVKWVAQAATSNAGAGATQPLVGLAVDGSAAYATGSFVGPVDFGDSDEADAANPSAFVWKLDVGTGARIWHRAFTAPDSGDTASAEQVTASGGTVAVAGWYTGKRVKFAGCSPPPASSTAGAGFVALLGETGCPLGTLATTTEAAPYAIASGPNGLVVAGSIGGGKLKLGSQTVMGSMFLATEPSE